MKKLLCIGLLLLEIHALEVPNEMELLYRKNACSACHGMYGGGMGSAPRLQGLSEKKLLTRLKNLQEGKTRSPFGTIMISFAQSLTKEQTIKMAKYLSTLKTVKDQEVYELEYEDNTGDGSS